MTTDRLITSIIIAALVAFGFAGHNYVLDLVAIAIIFGLLAASVDFSWGYCGVLNLGPAFYFGVGAYFAAYGLKHGWPVSASIITGMMASITIAGIIGYVAFRRRASVVQFGLIGLAISLTAQQIAVEWYGITGGSNGITNVPRPQIDFGVACLNLESPRAYYFVVCAVVAILFWGLVRLSRSHFGKMMICAREDTDRLESLGYNPWLVKLSATLVTAAWSTLAGALYVPISGIAHPGLFGITSNVAILVWIAIGGRGSIVGPFICAVALKLIESELGSHFEDIYILILGVLLVLCVLVWPRGLAGTLEAVEDKSNSIAEESF